MKKRILSAFLVLCMMLTMVPTAALAAEDPGGGNGSDRVHTESNDGVVVDKTVNYDEDGNYSLTLEAYVTNEVTKEARPHRWILCWCWMSPGRWMMTWERALGNIPPLMNRDGRIATSTGLGGRRIISAMMTATTTKWKLKVMVLGEPAIFHRVLYRQRVLPGLESARYYQQEPECQPLDRYFYTRQEITTSKMEAMQSAVNGFIDQVAENAAGARQ